MILKFEGVVSLGDSSRCDSDDKHGALLIGERDVVSEVGEAQFAAPVTCAICVGTAEALSVDGEPLHGALDIDEGWGYSEYTPMERDKLFIGPHDLIAIIGAREGEAVTVWFADEPVNALA